MMIVKIKPVRRIATSQENCYQIRVILRLDNGFGDTIVDRSKGSKQKCEEEEWEYNAREYCS